MTKKLEKELLKMKFTFISEVKPGIYEKVNAKEVWDEGTKVDIVGDKICFWDTSGNDNRYCLPISDILLNELHSL